MNALPASRTRLGVSLLLLALALGVLGDLLLRSAPWGLNVTIVTVALIGAGAWLVHRHHLPASNDAPWLATTAILCAIAFVRRDSTALQVLDGMVLLGTLALTMLATQGAAIRLRGISAYGLALCSAAAHAWFGAPRLVFGDIRWQELPIRGRWRELGAVGTGLMIALPLLLLFGALFVSADAAFESLVAGVQLDVATLMSHAALTGVCAAFAAGVLRGASFGDASVATLGERAAPPAVRFATTATVLGALDLLFLVFVAVQLRWLFGGMALVQATTGLTIAEYARRGFFELVTASALVIPVLLTAEWATLREGSKQETSFRALATLLVLLVGVLLASALQRMLLYVGAFGLTEQRLYTTAFMVWVALVCGWLAWTVLRGARARFAFGALVQGLAVLAGLHLANPDALITRVNVAAAASPGPEFDAKYVAGQLSADAVPALLDALPRLSGQAQGEVAARLLERWGSPTTRDWRSWNWADRHARFRVRAREAELRRLALPVPDGR
jgi:hypothetical protein